MKETKTKILYTNDVGQNIGAPLYVNVVKGHVTGSTVDGATDSQTSIWKRISELILIDQLNQA